MLGRRAGSEAAGTGLQHIASAPSLVELVSIVNWIQIGGLEAQDLPRDARLVQETEGRETARLGSYAIFLRPHLIDS